MNSGFWFIAVYGIVIPLLVFFLIILALLWRNARRDRKRGASSDS